MAYFRSILAYFRPNFGLFLGYFWPILGKISQKSFFSIQNYQNSGLFEILGHFRSGKIEKNDLWPILLEMGQK